MAKSKLLTNIAIANSNTSAATLSVTPLTTDPLKKPVLARWLVDKNFKLDCQWIMED